MSRKEKGWLAARETAAGPRQGQKNIANIVRWDIVQSIPDH
jgi:hypothetical protein